MNRREALEALGAIAATRWATEEIDPGKLERWDPPEGRCGYTVGEFEPENLVASIDVPHVRLDLVDGRDLEELFLGVYYDNNHVNIDVDGSGERGVRGGSLALLEPDVAREVAVAIYMAAEAVERGRQA